MTARSVHCHIVAMYVTNVYFSNLNICTLQSLQGKGAFAGVIDKVFRTFDSLFNYEIRLAKIEKW